MPIYNYQIRTKEGQIQTGRVEAPDPRRATEILQQRGFVVVGLERTEEAPAYAKRLTIFERISGKDLAIFSRQLATLFAVEVPLVTALNTLAKQTQKARFREVIAEVASDVDGGLAFSDALARHSDIFSDFYVHMIKAGEASGKLHEVLSYLADHTEREHEIKSKIKGAMTYPAFVLFAFFIVGIIMMVFVIPNLTDIIEQSGQELPVLTRLIIGTSNALRSYWYLFILVLFGGGVGFWQFLKTEQGQDLWDKVQLRLPVAGGVFQRIYIFRFADSLATLIRGGLPIMRALDITAGIVGNSEFQKIIQEARERVRRGQGIAPVLRLYSQIPPLVPQMVAVGEKTGKLDEILEHVARFYRKEVDATIDNATSLLEPLLIGIMGIGVGILLAGVLMPIYNMAGSF